MAASLLAHRYFFAALPDAITARRTHVRTERRFGPEGILRADRLHVTLAITPDFATAQPGLEQSLLRAGDRVEAPPFDLAFDQLSLGHRSIALRPRRSIPPLRALQTRIVREMTAQGASLRPDWQFSPHMTLAYRTSLPATEPVQAIRWPVTEFVLVHSFVGLTRHVVLGRWALEEVHEEQLSLFAS